MSELDSVLLSKNGKIIHQIWWDTIQSKKKTRESYEKMRMYRESWTEKNPDWYRMEWNKPDSLSFLKQFYPEHLETFLGYKYEIQRCDFVRYLFLHRYGGWYVDMDYYCNRPMTEALKQFRNSIYFVQSPNSFMQESDHISNSLIYSTPGHPFWRQLVLELEQARNVPYFYTKHLAVMFTTGPGILNRIYHKYKYRYKLKSLPWKLFHPFGIKDVKMSLRSDSAVYAVHIGAGTWENKDSKFLLFLVRHWAIVLFIILGLFSQLLINVF